MLEALVLRGPLSAFSVMFRSLGVFFTYLSFLKPALGAQELLFLGTASTIVWTTPPN